MKAILLAPFTRSQVTEGFQRGFSKVAETRFLRAASFVGDFLVGAFTFLIFFSWQPLKEKKPFERPRLSSLEVGAGALCGIMIYPRRLLLSSRSNILLR